MSDLHKLAISAPDGSGLGATVMLDDRPLQCRAITLHLDARSLTSVTIEFDAVMAEFTGMAEVVAKLLDESSEPAQ
jgi:hypothetical protein